MKMIGKIYSMVNVAQRFSTIAALVKPTAKAIAGGIGNIRAILHTRHFRFFDFPLLKTYAITAPNKAIKYPAPINYARMSNSLPLTYPFA
ncbi:hypothetical protein [Sporosarcina sp. P19]|uniref:hypothetical protein n=1 Tax=Sporosarcina sp. P19 TaxID=2048258 RepID=UPI00130420F1|nr:hypothetical protein [Sporosarcina sp. P19]